jgi:hypothetical protein
VRCAACIAYAALLVFASACAQAADVVPFIENGMLGARVRDLDFPASFPKDLSSGLTSHLMLRLSLRAPGRPDAQRVVELAVKYDLWEETYRLTLSVDGRVLASDTQAGRDALLARLRDARLPSLFPEGSLAPGVTYSLHADVLLNPIDAERMEKIRKWVAENSAYTPGQADVPATGTTTTSNELFNRIFEQFATGSKTAAIWRETVVSSPFRPESVPHERP